MKWTKLEEQEHGKNIQHDAAKIWGWASPAGKLRAARRLKECLPYFSLEKKNKVLEIGCGIGIFTSLFYQNGVTPIAIDISYDLLAKAKKDSPDVIFIQADAENLPFKENVFDYVYGVSVLHHLKLRCALESIRPVLKGTGVIIFSEPNMANPQVFLQKRISWLKKNLSETPAETAFFRWRLRKILAQCGFTRIIIYPFEFLHPLTPQLLINFIKKLEFRLERIPAIREVAGSLLIFAKK